MGGAVAMALACVEASGSDILAQRWTNRGFHNCATSDLNDKVLIPKQDRESFISTCRCLSKATAWP